MACVAFVLAMIAGVVWFAIYSADEDNPPLLGSPVDSHQSVMLRNAASIPLSVGGDEGRAPRVKGTRIDPGEDQVTEYGYPRVWTGKNGWKNQICIRAVTDEGTLAYYRCQTLRELEAAGWRMELTVGDIEGR